MPTSAEHRLKKLGIKLPTPQPFGTYAETVQTGNLLFLSGMLLTEGALRNSPCGSARRSTWIRPETLPISQRSMCWQPPGNIQDHSTKLRGSSALAYL